MVNKHRVIPVFVPEKACPHRCIYCNQFAIAGQTKIPTLEDVKTTIETHLATLAPDAEKRIAFFGGSFTGMSIEEQTAYLEVAQPYLRDGSISGIQLSTRPDYITQEILDNLKRHGVTLIELGAQSLDDNILTTVGRGHTVKQVEEASGLILQNGFQLGLQMMIGLPGDTLEKSLRTAEKIVSSGATCTRIYPTLVVKNTKLAQLYREGSYSPLSLEEAVQWCKALYPFFLSHNVNVLRVGLHPSEGLLSGSDYLAGPFHVSFKELVLTAIWHDKIQALVDQNPEQTDLEISVPAGDINYAVGYGSANRKAFPQVRFKVENGYKVELKIDGGARDLDFAERGVFKNLVK